MKYVDEFRAQRAVASLVARIAALPTRAWTIMEICGGQTHTIARYGLEDLIGEQLTLLHGPGCPVCVTPLEVLERARRIALLPGVVLYTFGDMLRVPGLHGDLLDARAQGGRVDIMLCPMDALRRAKAAPDMEHVFFGIGFETTAPATAMVVELADRLALTNFSVLASHVRVPPAMEAILSSPAQRVDGFLAAGHVCTVEGFADDYPALAERYRTPIVVTGFEPVDILHGLHRCVRQLERGEHRVENAYPRAAQPEGNRAARAAVHRVFDVVDSPLRGLGVLAKAGLRIRPRFARFDAGKRFPLDMPAMQEPTTCRAGLVLQGRLSPPDCPEFGRACTPERPLGAPMVSSEGACAAYYRFRRRAARAH